MAHANDLYLGKTEYKVLGRGPSGTTARTR